LADSGRFAYLSTKPSEFGLADKRQHYGVINRRTPMRLGFLAATYRIWRIKPSFELQ
jgi:hypothetical protein